MNVAFNGKIESENWKALKHYYYSKKELEKAFGSFDQWLLDLALYKFDEMMKKENTKG